MLGFKRFHTATVTISGIELAAKIKKHQFKLGKPPGRPKTIRRFGEPWPPSNHERAIFDARYRSPHVCTRTKRAVKSLGTPDGERCSCYRNVSTARTLFVLETDR